VIVEKKEKVEVCATLGNRRTWPAQKSPEKGPRVCEGTLKGERRFVSGAIGVGKKVKNTCLGAAVCTFVGGCAEGGTARFKEDHWVQPDGGRERIGGGGWGVGEGPDAAQGSGVESGKDGKRPLVRSLKGERKPPRKENKGRRTRLQGACHLLGGQK